MAGETSNSIDEAAGEPLAALPEEAREGLTEALGAGRWRRYLIDIRLSLPLVLSRYYITIVAGRERRSGSRKLVAWKCVSAKCALLRFAPLRFARPRSAR